jgi:predicted TIM-barrel fold metal-dependent hydrolase
MDKALVFDCHHHYGTMSIGTRGQTDATDRPEEASSDRVTRLGRMADAEIDMAVMMPVNRYLRPNGASDTRHVNDLVAAYRDNDPDHFPVAVGITEPLHGAAGLEEIVRIDEELGMVGVSYHTRWQGVTTHDPLVVAGMELLLQRKLLAFVHAHSDSNMEAPFMIRHVAEACPELPIVVTDALSSPTQCSQLLSDIRDLTNVYVETSCAYNVRAVAKAVEALGPDRVLFGSDTYSAYMITMIPPRAITSLGFGDKVDTSILSGNLLRLLEWTDRVPELTARLTGDQASRTGASRLV